MAGHRKSFHGPKQFSLHLAIEMFICIVAVFCTGIVIRPGGIMDSRTPTTSGQRTGISWLRSDGANRRRRGSRQLSFETLEDRLLLSFISMPDQPLATGIHP